MTHGCLREQAIYNSSAQEASSTRDEDSLVIVVVPHFVLRLT